MESRTPHALRHCVEQSIAAWRAVYVWMSDDHRLCWSFEARSGMRAIVFGKEVIKWKSQKTQ